ncbi:hypothetical protein ACHAWF_009446 [Thalassiosira exigua]
MRRALHRTLSYAAGSRGGDPSLRGTVLRGVSARTAATTATTDRPPRRPDDRPFAASIPSTAIPPPPERRTPSRSSDVPSLSPSSPPSLSPRLFSTAAAAPLEEASGPPKRTPRSKKRRPPPKRKRNPLVVTPAAAARIQFLLDQHNDGGGNVDGRRSVGIRLGTKKRGCNGLSYTLNYAYDDHLDDHPRDEGMVVSLPDPTCPGEGLTVYVEPMALMNVIGTEMDFVDDEMSSEFTFTNPNSKGECGCGESFNV